jgi:predicted Zn-dependent protease
MLLTAALQFAATLGGAEPATAPTTDAAIELFRARRYPEARAALEEIVATHPRDARACHYLGRTLELRADANALPEALVWLQRAAELEPANSVYVGRYGGASLLLAERTRSPAAALRGRAAMERAVELNPDDLDAREGLCQFYLRAPWPLGSRSRARVHLDAIRQRDAGRALVLEVLERIRERDFAAAFRLCDEALARDPANYNALYQLGATALASGEQLERGLRALQDCAALTPPTPSSPSRSVVWQRIGSLQEKLHHPAEARAAYAEAVRLDAGNREAAAALATLK